MFLQQSVKDKPQLKNRAAVIVIYPTLTSIKGH